MGDNDPYCVPDKDGHIACRACREYVESQKTDKIKVGDRVETRCSGAGTVIAVHKDRAWVLCESGSQVLPERRELTRLSPDPPPDPPPGHIDRFWVTGAWIEHPVQTFIVVSCDLAVEFGLTQTDWYAVPLRSLREWSNNWSFHVDSPIQEEVE